VTKRNSNKIAPASDLPPKPKINTFFAKTSEPQERPKSAEKTTVKYIFIPGKAEQNRAMLKQITTEILFEGIYKNELFNTVTKALSAAKEKHKNLALFTVFEITIPENKLKLEGENYKFNLQDYITSTLNVQTKDGKVIESVELPAESPKAEKNAKSKTEFSQSSVPGAISEKSQIGVDDIDDIDFSPEKMPESPSSRKP
jgi:Ser-tRNA(Ala) deacylase AlaX